MATEGDRSLSSGLSFPQWMKNKIDTRLDFDEGSFSPPEHNDSFLYIRYPRTNEELRSTAKPVINDVIVKEEKSLSSNLNKFDFSNHTAPCKQFIQTTNRQASTKQSDVKIKSNGTDDGFKGEGAACGSSVVRVAHQMVNSKLLYNSSDGSDEECATQPKNFNPSARRGSKSLPTTPISSPNTSPKSRRRLHNKYFTGAFADNESYQGSWILSGLLGKRDTITRSMCFITEEDAPKSELIKAVSEVNLEENTSESLPNKQVYKAKPSELREMNFWSPTSM